MTLAIFLVGLAVVAATSVFVVAPLFWPRPAGGPAEPPGERERWERQKRQALEAMAALERRTRP